MADDIGIVDLPYKAEYAKSNRASCKGCKSSIGKDTLRLAVMVQSPMFDGRVPNWYHYSCFFTKQRPKTAGDIANFENLRWDDQQKIKEKIEAGGGVVLPTPKGKKRALDDNKVSKIALKDYVIEYSKSSRATCRGCEQKIMKDEVRISKKDYETDVGKRYGGQDMWHHVPCFAKLRSELGYFESGDKLPGFRTLSNDDQADVKKQLPQMSSSEIPAKQIKKEDTTDSKMSKEEALMKKQNKIMFGYRDKLKALSKKELGLLFEANDQDIPPGVERMLERLSDCMAFGALKRCSKCGDGQFVFKNNSYVCQGDLTEWSKCQFMTSEPERKPFIVPTELQSHAFLAKYKYTPMTRIIKYIPPTVVPSDKIKKEEDQVDGPKVEREKPALYLMPFVIIGKTKTDKDELKAKIVKYGGRLVTKLDKTVMAVISNEDEIERMGSRMSEARNLDIHVVPESFIDKIEKYKGKIPELILKKNIASWGSDPSVRLPQEPTKSASMKSKSGSLFTKSLPSKVNLKIKGGLAVDPDSGLEDVAHVFVSGKDKYSVVLGLTDIQKQKNSYYKIQLLESDKKNKYWVFRAWGRIGTTIGSNKLESMESLHSAKMHFKSLYEEKSGNVWEHRDHFVKVPGLMYPIDVDYGEEDKLVKLDENVNISSKLKPEVQELIKLIFNVDSMNKVMLEFELDTEKMPLGKLSKKQLQSAFSVLSELQQLIEKQGSRAQFIDASNRFYTMVPHSFGIDNPPILDSSEMIKQKADMLENLMEMEIAYNLMKTTTVSGDKHPVDCHYEQLRAEIDVLQKEHEDYQIIQEYVKNTHAETHGNYELEIDQVYSVKRQGEEKRYKPFRKLHRKLLWHGSRLTNYAGILSQGLRIAPPEAPSAGYMFGKGIYFADMVSKSANYCCTTSSSPTGLLLLCEVALGEMHEKTEAEFIAKLPSGKHSVKGVGMTEPDPSVMKIKDGVHIPLGKGVKKPIKSSLLYNEYIVYDVAQVNIKYLLKVNFKHKY